MRALTLTGTDGLASVAMADHPLPKPGAGDVRVAIRAAALNHRELWITRGMYPGMVLPTTMGADGAGVVDAVGEGVDSELIGQDVVLYPGLNWGDDPRYPGSAFGLLGMPGPGTIANMVVVPADSCVTKPAHLSWTQAAALPLGGLTAWRGLVTKAGLQDGETVLVTGAGGGVATMATSLAHAIGATVWVTSGSDDTIARAAEIGAAGGFNYRDEDWRKALGKAAGGIDVVFDGAPASGYPGYGRALAMGARVVIYGSTGGGTFTANAPELFLKNIQLMGTNVGNPQEFRDMIAFVSKHSIVPVIDREFAFDDAVAALGYLESGHGFGKVVISF